MAQRPVRYNVNVLGVVFFLLAAGAGYWIGDWKGCLLVVGVLGCIKAGRMFWVSRPSRQNSNGEDDA